MKTVVVAPIAPFERAAGDERSSGKGRGLTVATVGAQIPEPKFELPLRSHAELEGRDVVVERRIAHRWQFLSLSDNEPIFRTDQELAALMASGEFRITSINKKGEKEAPPLSPLVVGVNHASNLRKHEYVQACLAAPGGFRRSRPLLTPIIQDVAAKLKEEPAGFTTVLEWIDEHHKHSDVYGTACYSDKHYKKGHYGHQLAKHQEQAIDYGIDRFLNGATKRVAYRAVRRHVRLYDIKFGQHVDKTALGSQFVDDQNRLKPPSERTFQRRCNEIDPLLRECMRKGIRSTEQKFRTFATLPLPSQPLAEVEVDHCTLDIVLIDPSGLPLGRPDLIVFRDRATGMVLGYGLGFEKPSYAAFLRGLRHAMYRKEMWRYPAVKHGWPCFGRFKNLDVDNALHFIGDNISNAGRELKFNIIRFHARRPWEKGALERFFGTFGVAVVHMLPGTTLENVLARKDHQNLGEASLTIEEFEGLFVQWLCDDYHVTKRRGLGSLRGIGDIPLRVWAEKAKNLSTPPLPPEESFVALAGDWEMRTINKYGIEWDYIRYEGPILSGVMAHPDHQAGMKYKVSRDPWDLGCVYLYNHRTHETLKVPATIGHQQVVGRTLHQHRVMVSYAKLLVDLWERDHWEAICKASVDLAELSEKIRRSPRRKTIEAKVARFLEWDRGRPIRSRIDVPTPNDGSGERYLSYEPQGATVHATSTVAGEQVISAVQSPPQTANPDTNDDEELAAIKRSRNWSAST